MFNVRLGFREATPLGGCGSRGLLSPKWLLLATVPICLITPAKAEYRLHAGDVIEIAVARVPELKQRVPVQMDGTISYPLLGTISVANQLPAEMQAKVQATLASKVFRQRTPDGRENSVAIDPDEVTGSVPRTGAHCTHGNCDQYVAITCQR